MPKAKTIATVTRHSTGQGITEVSLPQPTQVSMIRRGLAQNSPFILNGVLQ
jgi:hypothetical protein